MLDDEENGGKISPHLGERLHFLRAEEEKGSGCASTSQRIVANASFVQGKT